MMSNIKLHQSLVKHERFKCISMVLHIFNRELKFDFVKSIHAATTMGYMTPVFSSSSFLFYVGSFEAFSHLSSALLDLIIPCTAKRALVMTSKV